MTRHVVIVPTRPPGPIQRLWYRIIRLPAPLAVHPLPKHGDLIRLLPWRWTTLHRWFARKIGAFWLPCILCRREYGGHQSAGGVPDPTYGPDSGRSIGICPQCTRAGRNVNVRFSIEDELDAIYERHEHGHPDLIQDCTQCQTIHAEIIEAFQRPEEGP